MKFFSTFILSLTLIATSAFADVTKIHNVASGTTTISLANLLYDGDTTLIEKTGAGTLSVTAPTSGYLGNVDVLEGIMTASGVATFGNSLVTVASGATLRVSRASGAITARAAWEFEGNIAGSGLVQVINDDVNYTLSGDLSNFTGSFGVLSGTRSTISLTGNFNSSINNAGMELRLSSALVSAPSIINLTQTGGFTALYGRSLGTVNATGGAIFLGGAYGDTLTSINQTISGITTGAALCAGGYVANIGTQAAYEAGIASGNRVTAINLNVVDSTFYQIFASHGIALSLGAAPAQIYGDVNISLLNSSTSNIVVGGGQNSIINGNINLTVDSAGKNFVGIAGSSMTGMIEKSIIGNVTTNFVAGTADTLRGGSTSKGGGIVGDITLNVGADATVIKSLYGGSGVSSNNSENYLIDGNITVNFAGTYSYVTTNPNSEMFTGGGSSPVSQNVTVNITGGSVASSVYAGVRTTFEQSIASNDITKYAYVGGNTAINVSGGKIEGNVVAGGVGVRSLADSAAGEYQAIIRGNSAATVSGNANILLDVYGAGWSGCSLQNVKTLGNSSVTVSGGTIGSNVYGGGYGNYTVGDIGSGAEVGGNSVVTISGGTIGGNIYAGGNGVGAGVLGTGTVNFTGTTSVAGIVSGSGANGATVAGTKTLNLGTAGNSFNGPALQIQDFNNINVGANSNATLKNDFSTALAGLSTGAKLTLTKDAAATSAIVNINRVSATTNATLTIENGVTLNTLEESMFDGTNSSTAKFIALQVKDGATLNSGSLETPYGTGGLWFRYGGTFQVDAGGTYNAYDRFSLSGATNGHADIAGTMNAYYYVMVGLNGKFTVKEGGVLNFFDTTATNQGALCSMSLGSDVGGIGVVTFEKNSTVNLSNKTNINNGYQSAGTSVYHGTLNSAGTINIAEGAYVFVGNDSGDATKMSIMNMSDGKIVNNSTTAIYHHTNGPELISVEGFTVSKFGVLNQTGGDFLNNGTMRIKEGGVYNLIEGNFTTANAIVGGGAINIGVVAPESENISKGIFNLAVSQNNQIDADVTIGTNGLLNLVVKAGTDAGGYTIAKSLTNSGGEIKPFGGTYADNVFTVGTASTMIIDAAPDPTIIAANGRLETSKDGNVKISMSFNSVAPITIDAISTQTDDIGFQAAVYGALGNAVKLSLAYAFDIEALASGDSVVLSFFVGDSTLSVGDFTIFHKADGVGTKWATTSDYTSLSYDGEYLSFTVTHFSDYGFAAIPEPASLALMGLGLGIVALLRRKKLS